MANLVIADAEVELVPGRIASHSTVRAGASRRGRKPTECLLDSSLHYAAMRPLPDAVRRGRADIAHFCLLLSLDSIPSREGRLRTYLHTRNDQVMEFAQDVRLPKNFNRFQGLMESALISGSVEYEGRELVKVTRETLHELLRRLGGRSVAMTEGGEPLTDYSLLRDANIIVGGFPHGTFLSDTVSAGASEFSLYHSGLMAWTAVSLITARI